MLEKFLLCLYVLHIKNTIQPFGELKGQPNTAYICLILEQKIVLNYFVPDKPMWPVRYIATLNVKL